MPRGGTKGNKGGRPTTGRKRAQFYVTNEEKEEIKKHLFSIRSIKLKAQEIQKVEPIKVETVKEVCKICGIELIEKTRRDDGRRFMGCPNYQDHKIKKN